MRSLARGPLTLLLALALLLGAGAPAAAAPAVRFADEPTPAFRAVADRLAAAMERFGVPGGALGVSHDGREEVAAIGEADAATGAPVTPRTRFGIGSVTKTYTGTAVMRLVDQGLIDLDAPVRRYVPELRLADESVAERLTVRHLMTHAGNFWGDGFADTGAGEDAIARYVREYVPLMPQLAPLGLYGSYSNAGFTLLGHVVERVAGAPYREAMRRLVLRPLGLGRTTFTPGVVLRGDHAAGHGPGGAPAWPLFLPAAVDPAGGAWASVGDLLRYARFHMGDGTAGGEVLIGPGNWRLMRTPQASLPDGELLGLYWPLAPLPDGSTLLTHSGLTFTHAAVLAIVPERRFAVAALLNSRAGAAVVGEALVAALEEHLGIPLPEPQLPETTPLPPERLAEYAGRYSTPLETLVLTPADGGLLLRGELHPPPWQVMPEGEEPVPDVRLAFAAPDVAIAGDDPAGAVAVRFLRRPEDGSVGWLSVGGRLYPRE